MFPEPLFQAPLLTQIHIVCAILAIVLGAVQFLKRKGTSWHKRIGWAWVAIMVVVAGTSLFMRDLNEGQLSITHAFTILTVFALPGAIYAIRKGAILQHRALMMMLYIGGLTIAAVFTLMPGRLLHKVLFGG
jgi:uncharacterized membrane protein